MGEKVINVSESFGRFTLTTTSDINNKMEADRVFFCAGIIPNTEFMKRHLAKALDERNQIIVNENFRVEGRNNIWALGDCNNTPETKTAYVAGLQATYLIKNFSKMVRGKKVSNYEFQPFPPIVMVLSLGPLKGIFAAGSRVLSSGSLAVTAKSQFQTIYVTKMNQEKSLLKIDYDKILTKDLKSPVKDSEEDEEEEGKAMMKKVEEEFGFH